MKEYVEMNRLAWDHEAERGNIWTDGCTHEAVMDAKSGKVEIILTPFKNVPASWLGTTAGKKILCLACGGGQQGILLAAAGASVTVLDISPKQIEQEKRIAAREGLQVEALQGDMLDLSRFGDDTFDMIYNPTSTCFVDDILSVYTQCNRIVKDDGYLLTSVTNPVLYMFDEKKEQKGKLSVKYTLPFSDTKSLSKKELEKRLRKYDTIEFSHTLDLLLGGICESGFSITGMYSDSSGCEILDSFVHDCYLAVRAKKRK